MLAEPIPTDVAEYFEKKFPGQPIRVVADKLIDGQAEYQATCGAGPTLITRCRINLESTPLTLPPNVYLAYSFITCGEARFSE